MSEVDRQGGDEDVATCHVCSQTFATQEELSKHLIDAHEDEGLGASA